MEQTFHINSTGKFEIDMPGKVTDEQYNAMKALIEFIQSFDDRPVSIEAVFEPIMGGLRIVSLRLGKVLFYGDINDYDDMLIIALLQLVAESYKASLTFDEYSHLLRQLLTTA